MQLECLSKLKQHRGSREHLYYVPASPVPPAAHKSSLVWSPAPASDTFPMEEPEPEPRRKASGKFDPLVTEVLEEVKKSVSSPPSVLTRRYTWGGDMGGLQKDADSHPELQAARDRRLAELLLPGLKRELRNAPPGERGELLEEMMEIQRSLGEDLPSPRVLAVSRHCDRERTAHDRRIAGLLLPSLKRELRNAPKGERGELLEEMMEVQRSLGEGIPSPRVFAVSRHCDRERGDGSVLPAMMRSVSW